MNLSGTFVKLKDWFKYGATKIDDGVFFKIVDRDTSKYIEGDHAVLIYIPILSGCPQVAIYKGSLRGWLPPHENEMMTDDDRARIINNICRYFDKGGVTYEVVEPGNT